jgi:hypothetical protein
MIFLFIFKLNIGDNKSPFRTLKITIFREKAWAKTKIATNIKIEIKKN